MPDTPSPGLQKLTEILAAAVAACADAVTLEYASGGGLEVMAFAGNSGVGYVLARELVSQVIKSLYEEKKKGRGKLRVPLDGQDYVVSVTTYDSFGETAHRLTFRPARR
jgi:hypothetical protein